MRKISAPYHEKEKKIIPKKINLLGHCQYQNKKALFTDSIFRDDLGVRLQSEHD